MSVDLFLVLSGFLITGILLDAKAGTGRYFRSFYGRRFLRIFPLYYGFLLFLLLVMPHFPEWMVSLAAIDQLRDDQLWFWFYQVNWATAVPDLGANIPLVHSHLWTLALEEQFYIVWPFMVLALSRRAFIALCLVTVPLALLFRVAVVEGWFGSLFYWNAAHVLPPAKMDALALGALVATLARGKDGLQVLARAAPYLFWGCIGVLAIVCAWQGGLQVYGAGTLTIGFTASTLFAMSVLVLAVTSRPDVLICRFLGHPFLTTSGTYSYAMYIVHLLIAFLLVGFLGRNDFIRTFNGSQVPFNILFNLGATAICFGIAFASWHLYEKQWLKLKRFFPYQRRRGAAAGKQAPVPDGAAVPAP